MPEYVKGLLPPPLRKPSSALLDIHLKLFTLNQLKVSEQTLLIYGADLAGLSPKLTEIKTAYPLPYHREIPINPK
jgi:hypothetical protein